MDSTSRSAHSIQRNTQFEVTSSDSIVTKNYFGINLCILVNLLNYKFNNLTCVFI